MVGWAEMPRSPSCVLRPSRRYCRGRFRQFAPRRPVGPITRPAHGGIAFGAVPARAAMSGACRLRWVLCAKERSTISARSWNGFLGHSLITGAGSGCWLTARRAAPSPCQRAKPACMRLGHPRSSTGFCSDRRGGLVKTDRRGDSLDHGHTFAGVFAVGAESTASRFSLAAGALLQESSCRPTAGCSSAATTARKVPEAPNACSGS